MPPCSPVARSCVARDVVAIAGCRGSDNGDPADLYPDPDAVPLQRALSTAGTASRLVSWDDPAVSWREFSRIVVSSTWDSVDRPTEYLEWSRRVAPGSALINDLAFIEWNLDKGYLRQLEAAGVPVIPTTWVAPGESWQPPQGEFVLKPAISAGGRSTARYLGADDRARAHLGALHDDGQTVMVQPYLASIDHDGEVDLVFFDGEFSHAVRKAAALALGRGLVERPWEQMRWEGQVDPDRRQLEVAGAALRAVEEAIGRQPVYGRVDLIRAASGEPLVLELELIDPYLSLDTVPGAAERLAAAILRTGTSPARLPAG